jgi:hypothetical protein
LAAPLNGAEIPKRISVSVIPRILGALALGASAVVTRAGAALVGCGADAIGRPAPGGAALVGCEAADAIGRLPGGGAALSGCGAADAIGRPGAGELTCADVVGASSLDLFSVVFVLNPNAFRHVVPSTKYTPIAAPNATAKVSETSHQGFQREGSGRMTSGSSDRCQIFASLSEEGGNPTLGISLPAPALPC